MLFKLIGRLTNLAISLATLPFRMLEKNFVGTLILFGLLYIFFWPSGDGVQPVKGAKTAKQANAKGQPVPVIEPVRKVQNGNSRFSDDLLSKMTQPELRHYSGVFYWVMDNSAAGQPYRWAYYNIDGTITALESFKNNHGHTCRQFQEVLKVHDTRQTFDGLACQRVEGGWCRLRFDSTALCGIAESGPGLLEGIGQKLHNLF